MRATLETLAIASLVGIAQGALRLVDLAAIFALSTPLSVAPWTVVTSVYAHGSIGHLLANALALLLVGPLVERRTTRLRFHAFVIGTGALAGITQVTLGGLLGPQTAVLGLSGAVFGLGGYLLASNVVSATLFDRLRLSTRAQFALFGLAALVLTATTAAPGVALIAHATGAFCGLVTGRAGLLDVQ
ncbi:rhomboid family intramembrane serine protease [Halorubrum lacusprofundi]|jgi:membrane associated rhomboid family serine protease|uniref:Rhomboid family protein n=1 Tax=Halorubrum lacusprofundi (strain ATCC 49239 / DSM 5036 / JCM 8891 / ACAM 34) TaxID=416348 RepID=B9LRE0_HALLT|nr:rhomboid family intramembrane serine protease [Halorubrum lacusprofundi]ACM55763.1 Rhomboid family protein [Halorubrum lacusprofundi ATCC 49239]MCG1007233.1 rhomboid family intramembrane serine protease [Halorubrum lacusprofundi]